jgi:GntR family transcriptional regulator
MHRVHAIGGQPYAVLRLYLDDRLYRALPPARFETDTVVCALKSLRPSPIRSGRQHVSIGRAAADDASWLEVPHDSPVARIRRYFEDRKGTLIYLGDVVYRGDFVSWEMDLDV